MSLTISAKLLVATTCPGLQEARELVSNWRRETHEYKINIEALDDKDIQDLVKVATAQKDVKTARAAESIALARKGTFNKPVPNFKAFQGVLQAFLASNLIDGWIYVTGPDGKVYPELVTGVSFDDGGPVRGNTPSVRLHTASYTISDDRRHVSLGTQHSSHSFHPADVAHRRISDILAAKGIYKETNALRAAYDETITRHRNLTQKAFAKQFRVNGQVYRYQEGNYRRQGLSLTNRKVVHDLKEEDYGAFEAFVESSLFENTKSEGVGRIPEHPLVRVFDLKTHDFFWVHSDNLSEYKYDKSLADKLILPASHRDLIEVLTTDLDAFVDDIVEGKSAGNVILCKGIAGVGKTLTAESVSEIIEKPLYAIHSGNLGTTAEDVQKNLQVIFERGKRWNALLLLDEADVFVTRRGDNLEQNAIVAEFLRTLEYFDGLLFLTTNRPNDIDEAIISRCAAIIHYDVPTSEAAAAIWRVMANQYGTSLKDSMVNDLVRIFPGIAARDIKMLFRLALRVSRKRNLPLDLDLFRRCAMFRAIKMAPSENKAA